MSTKERLKQFIKSLNITISSFEKSINASNGYVNSISKGIGKEKLEKILEVYPNFDVKYVLTGEKENNKVNTKEKIVQTLQSDTNHKFILVNEVTVRELTLLIIDNIDIFKNDNIFKMWLEREKEN